MNDRNPEIHRIEDSFDEPICKCGHYRVCHRPIFPESAPAPTSFAPPGTTVGSCRDCDCRRYQFKTTHEIEEKRARERESSERILFVIVAVVAILLVVMIAG